MQNKLQELTDKLYNEGLSKGRQEAEEMKAKAKEEAARIISEAKKEAEKIVSEAKQEAAESKTRVENDLRMASEQTISAIRQQVEKIVVARAVEEPVKSSLTDVEFIGSVIMTIAKAFNASNPEPAPLDLVLPLSMQKELTAFLEKDAIAEMKKGIEVSFTKQIQGGFKIGPANGGFMISFAEGDFQKLLTEYLRPATRRLLFG